MRGLQHTSNLVLVCAVCLRGECSVLDYAWFALDTTQIRELLDLQCCGAIDEIWNIEVVRVPSGDYIRIHLTMRVNSSVNQ